MKHKVFYTVLVGRVTRQHGSDCLRRKGDLYSYRRSARGYRQTDRKTG